MYVFPVADLLLQEDLVQVWPMITETNAMSEELDKKCKFEIALVSPQAMGKKHGRTEVSLWYSKQIISSNPEKSFSFVQIVILT